MGHLNGYHFQVIYLFAVLVRASKTASLELHAAAAWTRLIATYVIKETNELVRPCFGDGLDFDCDFVAGGAAGSPVVLRKLLQRQSEATDTMPARTGLSRT